MISAFSDFTRGECQKRGKHGNFSPFEFTYEILLKLERIDDINEFYDFLPIFILEISIGDRGGVSLTCNGNERKMNLDWSEI